MIVIGANLASNAAPISLNVFSDIMIRVAAFLTCARVPMSGLRVVVAEDEIILRDGLCGAESLGPHSPRQTQEIEGELAAAIDAGGLDVYLSEVLELTHAVGSRFRDVAMLGLRQSGFRRIAGARGSRRRRLESPRRAELRQTRRKWHETVR